jgi:hypothetical protein
VTSTYVWKWILAHIWYALGSTPGTGCDRGGGAVGDMLLALLEASRRVVRRPFGAGGFVVRGTVQS